MSGDAGLREFGELVGMVCGSEGVQQRKEDLDVEML
jgi:hypothetical protein